MAKSTDSKDAPKEKEMAGCKCSTWIKMLNMIIGGCMIAYSFFSFFDLHADANSIVIYTFKVYEM